MNSVGGGNVGAGSVVGNNGGNPNLATISNMQSIQVQKYLTNVPPHNLGQVPAFNPNAGGINNTVGLGSGGGTNQPNPTGQPSTQQLRMLVQQIQMAVQAGYLNHQILNQPLAPQTLVLLNQLLNYIKVS